MFGIDVEKLAIIGVVALIVIGPERLPAVARTVGTLIGRAQRYLADVRAEVTREMQLEELRQMRDTVRDAAQEVGSSIQSGLDQTKQDIVSTISSVKDSIAESGSAAHEAASAPPAPAINPVKLSKWRRNRVARQNVAPLWYRQTQRRRTRVISAAARVARYRVRSPSR
jgi:sec-independent protein translocase protein TatB